MASLTLDQVAHYGDSKQPAMIASSIVFLVICNISVIVRIVSQWRVSRRLFVDDYAIVFATICSDISGALYLNTTSNGFGLHIYRMVAEDPDPPQHLISLFQAYYVNAVLTGPTFFGIKLSLLWFYRRTFLVNQKWLRVAWWINVGYIILWTVGCTLFYIAQCIPPDYYWQRVYLLLKIPPPTPLTGECRSATPELIALPLILSLASDFGILLLPVVTLARLHMRTSRKLGLIVIFSLGSLACCCEIFRIWCEVTVSMFADPTYDDVSFVILTLAEANIAIVAACAPLIASQWQYLFKKVHFSRSEASFGSKVLLKPRHEKLSLRTLDTSDSQEQLRGESHEHSRTGGYNDLIMPENEMIEVKNIDMELGSGTIEK
ncbi:hypothetical protein MMC11_008443 [Xylographa trunciseda]|nr:hypothetical protein [Xylographa trunciseda]